MGQRPESAAGRGCRRTHGRAAREQRPCRRLQPRWKELPPDLDQAVPLDVAARACCCPARPVLAAVMPSAASRPHPVDLLLCGHHLRVSQAAARYGRQHAARPCRRVLRHALGTPAWTGGSDRAGRAGTEQPRHHPAACVERAHGPPAPGQRPPHARPVLPRRGPAWGDAPGWCEPDLIGPSAAAACIWPVRAKRQRGAAGYH
jgi:hypothetical protein